MSWLLALVMTLGACGSSTSVPASHESGALAQRLAREIFFAQLAAARDGDSTALQATFAFDAVVLARVNQQANRMTSEQWLARAPDTRLEAISDITFRADGDDMAVWFIAELTLVESGSSHQTRRVIRISEAATASASWKVVAAAIGEARVPSWSPDPGSPHVVGSSQRGRLADLVDRSRRLRGVWADGAIIAGSRVEEPPTVGAEARRRLKTWTDGETPIHGEVRDVIVGGLEILQTHLADGTQLLVVARRHDDDLRVVLLHDLSV